MGSLAEPDFALVQSGRGFSIRLIRRRSRSSTRAVHLPLFAMMNPRAYTAWRGRQDARQTRFFEPRDRR